MNKRTVVVRSTGAFGNETENAISLVCEPWETPDEPPVEPENVVKIRRRPGARRIFK